MIGRARCKLRVQVEQKGSCGVLFLLAGCGECAGAWVMWCRWAESVCATRSRRFGVEGVLQAPLSALWCVKHFFFFCRSLTFCFLVYFHPLALCFDYSCLFFMFFSSTVCFLSYWEYHFTFFLSLYNLVVSLYMRGDLKASNGCSCSGNIYIKSTQLRVIIIP